MGSSTSTASVLRAGSAVVAAVLLAATGAAAGQRERAVRAWPQGLAAVGFDSRAALRRALAREPGRIVRMLPRLRVAEIRPRHDVGRFAREVSQLPGISYVERLSSRDSTAEPALAASPATGQAYEWQWAATREDAVAARVLRAAQSVTIAVIDTGADVTAPDLAAKAPITHNVGGSDGVADSVSHGTFVSALAAGSVTNGDGIAGFGGDAKLMVVQASDPDGTFTDLDEANAIVWAVDHGARILNLSLAGTDTSSTERAAIEYAVAHGALLVAAAGNEHDAGNPIEYPAALLQPVGSDGEGGIGLSVGASGRDGRRAGFSNTGSWISLVAPGEGVFSALPAGTGDGFFLPVALPGSHAGTYGLGSGTSFAAPQVAGAAALVWAAKPSLTAAQVAELLKQTASGKGAWSEEAGYGVLDVAGAVARASDGDGAPAAASVSLSGRMARPGTVELSWRPRGGVRSRVAVSQDGAAPRILLAATQQTHASFDVTFGHTYSFTVSLLGEAGEEAAVSAPFVVSLPRARAEVSLAASIASGRSPFRASLRAALAPQSKGVPATGRTLVLEALSRGAWREVSRAVTSRAGRADWRFTLARGTYRLRVNFPGADDLSGATSTPLLVRVR